METQAGCSNEFSYTGMYETDPNTFYHSSEYECSEIENGGSNDTTTAVTTGDKRREKKTTSFPFGKCRICYDSATGVHYGVVTCEGCKGFFKRSITQGLPYRCFFGDNCIVNIETRNRCKACRFKRCIQEGMSMDSVKMGRIPKKIKERALQEYQRERFGLYPTDQQLLEDSQQKETFYNEYMDHFEMDNYNSLSGNTESLSSASSMSSTNSGVTVGPSVDLIPEVIFKPESTFENAKPQFNTTVVNDSTASLMDGHFYDLMNGNTLSSLSLPTIFYESDPSKATSSNNSNDDSNMSVKTIELSDDDNDEHLPSLKNAKDEDIMTVLKYISKLNKNALADYELSCELHYSKHVLPIMKYLAPKLCQPFFIYELDFEVTSFFRYVRWKMLKLYSKHLTRLQILIEKMCNTINLGITDHARTDVTLEELWEGIKADMPGHVTKLSEFAKEIPGFNELNVNDVSRILNNRVLEFWMIVNYPLFYKDESYLVTRNGLHYSRHFMNQIIGKETTDALHRFSQSLHQLNLTNVEHSLTIPIVLFLPDEQLNDIESVHIVKYCYMYALYIQLCTTRTEAKAKWAFESILQTTNLIGTLNELFKKNIGQIQMNKQISNK